MVLKKSFCIPYTVLYGTPYSDKKPYIAMGAIHAMREKVFAGDTLCEIDFKAAYTFKDSLCQTNFTDVRIFKNGNPRNIETGFGGNQPYATKHEPKYNAYKRRLFSSQGFQVQPLRFRRKGLSIIAICRKGIISSDFWEIGKTANNQLFYIMNK